MQLSLTTIKPWYFEGCELKPKKGYGNTFSSTGSKVRKFIVGGKDDRGLIKLHERNIRGFAWLLTEKEIETYFEAANVAP